MTDFLDFINSMKTELKELTTKIKALNNFIHGNEKFKTLGDLEQVRMIKQAAFMEAYSKVLNSRLLTAVNTAKLHA